VLNCAYVAIILYAGARVGAMLIGVLLYGRPLRWLRSLTLRAELVRSRSARLLGWVTAGLWLWVTLGLFAVREPILEWLAGALAFPFTAGTVSISLGDLLAFAVTLIAALLLSGLLRVVLRDDVFPRFALGRGIPHAVTATLHYALLFFGFFLALAAAGVDFSRFTILAGALGVGIGFGLQNVVNNFVSGLILLYERPVQVGDTLEVGELTGEIKRIGIRSSTIRTWQGAEVIVPNSNLISESVINWTLSDRHRRIEIPVGVSYGSDPPQVAALLLDVVRSHPMILAEPAPQVLFQGFGESSLDFEARGWTERFETHVQTRSEITFAIHAALRAAGIEIPFPQRDLHLRSVAESVALAPAQSRTSGEGRDAE
jgi:small-conductance mechanosensitive channel